RIAACLLLQADTARTFSSASAGRKRPGKGVVAASESASCTACRTKVALSEAAYSAANSWPTRSFSSFSLLKQAAEKRRQPDDTGVLESPSNWLLVCRGLVSTL